MCSMRYPKLLVLESYTTELDIYANKLRSASNFLQSSDLYRTRITLKELISKTRETVSNARNHLSMVLDVEAGDYTRSVIVCSLYEALDQAVKAEADAVSALVHVEATLEKAKRESI